MNPFQVVKDFERALCEYTGAPYAVTTTSCTMALLLAVAWHLAFRRPMANDLRGSPATMRCSTEIEIPKRTYVGVPYAILEAGGRPTFRDETWVGMYQLRPLPVWDSARWLRSMLYADAFMRGGGLHQPFVCVSFHWSKTLGIQQGGAILHDNQEADAWLRRARFDGRTEGVPPAQNTFTLPRAWHAYMSPETAAAGLVRLASLPRNNDPLPWGPGTNSDYPDLSQMAIFQ